MNFSWSISMMAIFLVGFLCPSCHAEIPCAPLRSRSCPGIENRATLVGFYLDDCWEEPCVFRKGQNVALEVDIELKENVEKLTAKIVGVIGAAEFAWPGGDKNVCNLIVSDHNCPLKQGTYFTYGDSLYIDPAYPSVNADVRIQLIDEKGQVQVCWMTRAQVRP